MKLKRGCLVDDNKSHHTFCSYQSGRWTSGSQRMVLRPAAATSSGNLLEMQMLRLHPALLNQNPEIHILTIYPKEDDAQRSLRTTDPDRITSKLF